MITSQGRRKSELPTVTAVASGSYFDLWKSGVNYQILDSDFYASLGVTGTIVQLGDATAVPILDVQGTINRIRNLETDSDSGISVVVSATEGAYLALDAQGDGTGVNVLDDTDNTFRAIKAGTGVSVALADDDIVVGVSATPGTSNVVNVSDVTDFPTAVGNVISLAADTIYFVTAIVDIGANTFSMGSRTVVLGLSPDVVGITSSAIGTLFANSAGNENEVAGLKITAPNCTIIGVATGGGTADFNAHELDIVSCAKVASVNAAFLFRFDNSGVDTCSGDCFTFTGSNSLFNFTTSYVLDYTGTVFELGTATFDRFNVDLCQFVSNAGTNKIIEGAASSANINASGIGDFTEVYVNGSITDSTTVFSSDVRWNFQGNNFISDSTTDALLSMQGNATDTTIGVAGTAVLVEGTWVVEEAEKMTGTTGGRVTYDAEKDVRMPLTASVSLEPSAGPADKTLSAYFAVNGTPVANSKRQASASSGSPASITMPWAETLESGDYVELYVANETDTTDILCSSATFRAG